MERTISYMTIDRVEEHWVVCEVENTPMDVNRPSDFYCSNCFMDEVDIEMFRNKCLPIFQGNVYSVAHAGGKIIEIISLEEAERQRRVAMLQNMGI